MNFKELEIQGCYKIEPVIRKDERGYFLKTFHEDSFREAGIEASFKEEYYSYSKKNVLRGMHFQLPPHEHCKLVYCSRGKVLDVFLDLRRQSATYGQAGSLELSAENGIALFFPAGIAHGFLSLEDCCMHYCVGTVYAPQHDTGVHWQSEQIPWPTGMQPLISERDQTFPLFKDFKSPF